MHPDLSGPRAYGGSGKWGIFLPFWRLAICWLFLQGPGRGLPRAATKMLRELLVNRRHRLPSTGSCFLRTDQLDGETDWKLRLPVACTQRLPTAAVSSPPCRGTNGHRPGRARKLGRPPGQAWVSEVKRLVGCFGALGALSAGWFHVPWPREMQTRHAGRSSSEGSAEP